jgi:DNA-binding XRE family transcriptional regulator
MKTALQFDIEKRRAVYESLASPLLAQLAKVHGLTVREFAGIFEISKSHAEEILNHRKCPSLELAFRIARYFEVTCDELWGWRFDDEGSRRPLVIEMPDKTLVRLKVAKKDHSALEVVKALSREISS